MNFKGFDEWIEIFKGGKQIDSNGVEHDGDAIIDLALKTFNPSYHEPPLTKGHPEHNDPSFGWVSSLKKGTLNGVNTLLMKAKDVVPDFEDMVKDTRYKKRSASFYPDGRLRHVGFLGAMPPAVKGLADLSFSDNDDATVFEFSETSPWTWNTIAGVFRKMREWLIEKEGKETADSIIPDWDIEGIKDAEKTATSGSSVQPEFGEHKSATAKKEEQTMTFKDFMEIFKFWKEAESNPDMQLPGGNSQKAASGGDKTFTEADIEAAKKTGAEAERKKTEVEFAEKERKGREKAAKKETSDWVGQRVKEGKILPSWAASGLVGFMQGLDAGTEIEFAEGTEKKTPLKFFQDLLEGLEKSPIFKELATKEKAGDSGDFAEAEKDQKLGEDIAAKVNPAEKTD